MRFVFDDVRLVTPERYGRFDVVVAMGVLYHLPDPHVLRGQPRPPRGRGVPVHALRQRQAPPALARGRAGHALGAASAASRTTNTACPIPFPAWRNQSFWLRQDDLLEMCRRAGFTRVEVMAQDDDPQRESSSWIELLLRK